MRPNHCKFTELEEDPLLNSHFLWTRVEQHLSLLLYEKWLKSILLRVEPTLRLR